MKYEIYYSYGGHCGKFNSLEEAWEHTKALIKGDRNLYSVEIRPENSKAIGGYTDRNKDSYYCFRQFSNCLYLGDCLPHFMT